MRIQVWKNGVLIGYVKRVKQAKGIVDMTTVRAEAKHGYKTYAEIQGDIDLCTMFRPDCGYVIEDK